MYASLSSSKDKEIFITFCLLFLGMELLGLLKHMITCLHLVLELEDSQTKTEPLHFICLLVEWVLTECVSCGV